MGWETLLDMRDLAWDIELSETGGCVKPVLEQLHSIKMMMRVINVTISQLRNTNSTRSAIILVINLVDIFLMAAFGKRSRGRPTVCAGPSFGRRTALFSA